jgi:lysophospholipase L1-like esterase
MSVVYGTPSVAYGASPITTTCTPVSGSTFPVGSSTVACTATDSRQRSSSCAFPIVVQSPARISLTKFVAFGDSITAGEDGSNPLMPWLPTDFPGALSGPSVISLSTAYPTVLQQQLAARYTAQTMVVANAGSSGEQAGLPETLTRFTQVVGSRTYESVLLMEGSNDIFGGDPAKIPAAINNLRTMLRTARSVGVRPYLATVPPMNPAGSRGRLGYATVPPLNDQIRVLAASESVTLVDINLAFGGNLTLLSADGLHPNAAGYELIARTFFTSLRSTLEISGPATAPLRVPHVW